MIASLVVSFGATLLPRGLTRHRRSLRKPMLAACSQHFSTLLRVQVLLPAQDESVVTDTEMLDLHQPSNEESDL